jgi:Xaa-Pro aminopeptidase
VPHEGDLTRLAVMGNVTPKFETIYRTVLAAQSRGIAAIRPDVKAHDTDAEARSVIVAAGFGGFFTMVSGAGSARSSLGARRVCEGSPDIL